tara:strand:+ start:786 stop:1055 length:270 start_codon:yes stop_codon:yes gene_type:complete
MSLDVVNDIIAKAIQVTLITSLPSITAGLIIGLLIAVIQAITQVQEQTLTFVPKMVVLLLVLSATFNWMSNVLLEFLLNLWENIPLYSK